MPTFLSMRNRQWLYGLAMMVVPLLVAYDALEPNAAPLWLAFAAAFLGIAAPATALANISPDERDLATADEPDIEVE
jgi:hypothetical protein